MEPGTYIAIAELAFKGACVAVKTFRKGLNFSNDADQLVVALEVERFRLHIWGENAGLAPPDGQPATLPKRLLPICDVLKDYLEQIEKSVQDVDGLSSRYGLRPTDQAPTQSARVRQLVERMQLSIPSSRVKLSSIKEAKDEDGYDEKGVKELSAQAQLNDADVLPLRQKRKTSTWKRTTWAIRDLDKFEKLVKDLGQRINKLNDLMTETEQRSENYRVNMVVVGSAVDKASLELIRAAIQGEPTTSQMRTAVERKALTVAESEDTPSPVFPQKQRVVSSTTLRPLSLDQFVLPAEFTTLKRFITIKAPIPGSGPDPHFYLLERKPFDANMQPADMARLASRIQRLVLLLHKPKSPDFRTPHAEGCIKSPAHSSYWIVFRYPLSTEHLPNRHSDPQLNHELSLRHIRKAASAPISLLTLLQPTSNFRPPLEQRLTLASTLCTTLSELYLSGWLHKSIRSDNILFPSAGPLLQPSSSSGKSFSPEETRRILSEPLISGFDYTRHESEWATIDRARQAGDVGAAMYRHPNYQGEAAQGYKVQYDVYSVGLVLVEIALWMPLGSFLEGMRKPVSKGKGPVTGRAATMSSILLESAEATLRGQVGGEKEGVELSKDMMVFYAPHAVELRRRVAARVETELAFRVGSPYCRAVKFCLEFADRPEDTGGVDAGEVGSYPAMEFYDNVVVPLAALKSP